MENQNCKSAYLITEAELLAKNPTLTIRDKLLLETGFKRGWEAKPEIGRATNEMNIGTTIPISESNPEEFDKAIKAYCELNFPHESRNKAVEQAQPKYRCPVDGCGLVYFRGEDLITHLGIHPNLIKRPKLTVISSSDEQDVHKRE